MTPPLYRHVGACARGVVAGVLAVGLAACGSNRLLPPGPVDVRAEPYAAFPGPPNPLPVPRPITARITHRAPIEPELARFIDRLTSAVERRAWDAVALFVEERALADRLVFVTDAGLPAHRAAAEALAAAFGLDSAEPALFPAGADRDADPFLGLGQIRTMTVQHVADGPDERGFWRATGYVRLDDRTMRPIAFAVTPTTRGPRVVVPGP